jgi:acetylornithine deacetylase/succinyl-diaminopimelate desuccinylase-like protein
MDTIHTRPNEILQNLIRFDTTNPPGNEAACIQYIKSILDAYGIESTLLSRDPNRLNLVARLKGQGQAPPLLLYGHVDVVTTQGQDWTHPPFAAEIHDGYLWGRGALDMKGEVAMFITAFLRAKAEGTPLPGDVILLVLADEENTGAYGAKFLVEEHPDLFKDVRYAFGEFGGFTLHVSGKRFYPIMVAERQCCWMRMTVHGPGGHGSMPVQGGSMAKIAHILRQLDRKKLPHHVTPVARQMIETLASELPFPQGLIFKQMLNPALSDAVAKLIGSTGETFVPLLHNTISPTIIRGGEKTNVIPSEISLELDGRLLPGFKYEDMQRELRALIGDDIEYELETTDYLEYPGEVDMSLFKMLGGILQEADPGAIPMPLLLTGVTDGRYLAQLGIQTYGFTPMKLSEDFNFLPTIHAADERIPVDAVAFGADAIFKAMQRIGSVG